MSRCRRAPNLARIAYGAFDARVEHYHRTGEDPAPPTPVQPATHIAASWSARGWQCPEHAAESLRNEPPSTER